jgi:CRP/FNR family transcriptional regulator, nitrogen oxide reductase regulator
VLRCENSDVSKGVAAQSNSGPFIVQQLNPPLFRGLAKAEIDLVLATAALRKCSRGALLSIEGEPANQFFMLLSGRARYFTLTEDGRRVILRWLLPTEVFGSMALMYDADRYLVSTELVRDAEVLVWSRADIRRLIVRFPRLLENVLFTTADYMRWYITAHLALISHSAPQRLARVLYRLSKDIGRPVPDGVELDITNEELADAAHITRFSTSRLLSDWQRNGVLTKRRGKIVLASSERLFSLSPQQDAAAI